MKRSALNEKQRALALLVALGQFSFQQIASQLEIHHNSVTNWLKDAQIQALVEKYQADIERKLLDMALESTIRDNSSLMEKAVNVLHERLDGKSSKKQLEAIHFLLHGAMPSQEKHQETPESAYPVGPLRLPEEVRRLLRPQ